MSDIKNTNLIPPSPQIDINSLKPFTRFCCSISAIPTSYLASMTYEEQLLWLCDYLENTVIPTINNNGNAVAELQGLYIQLKNYVDNYFTNLDVQEEINNKLNDMANNGTLYNLMKPYFDNVDTQINLQNDKINAITSGAPAGVYNTLSDLTSDDPSHDRIYLVTEDNSWYYYSAENTTWTKGGLYQSTIPLNSITPAQTTFAQILNIIDVSKDSINKQLMYPDFNLVNNSSFNTTDFIEVIPNENYMLNIANYDTIFYYDINKQGVSKVSKTGWGLVDPYSITIPSNVHYVRLCYLNNYSSQVMMLKGNNFPSSYYPYNSLYIDNLILNPFNNNTSNYGLSGKYGFCGDSICAINGGYASRLKVLNPNITINNYAVSGATVAKRTTRNDSVLEQLDLITNDLDFLILEGGVNDAWNSIPLGDFNPISTSSFTQPDNLDENTFSGALEKCFYKAFNKLQTKKIFFIIPHNVDIPITKVYMDRAVEICKKWSVILIDLRLLSGLNCYNNYMKNAYTNNSEQIKMPHSQS